MTDIMHRIEIEAAPDAIYKALTEQEGLSQWWTRDVTARPEVGSVAEFRFGGGGPSMEIMELEPARRVRWRCVDGPDDWQKTEFTFDLEEISGRSEPPLDKVSDAPRTVLRFAQKGWQEAGDFFAHCNSKWAFFLIGLKKFIETGKGMPYPDDLKI